MHEHLRQEVHTALLGHADTVIRRAFIRRFSSQFDAFEAALLAAYERWCQLDSAFAKDRDSATVVGTTFIVVARLTMSANLLTLGQITLSGAAFRHAIEALACAFVFADPEIRIAPQLGKASSPSTKRCQFFQSRQRTTLDWTERPWMLW